MVRLKGLRPWDRRQGPSWYFWSGDHPMYTESTRTLDPRGEGGKG